MMPAWQMSRTSDLPDENIAPILTPYAGVSSRIFFFRRDGRFKLNP